MLELTGSEAPAVSPYKFDASAPVKSTRIWSAMDSCIRFQSYQKHLLPKTKQKEEEDDKIYARYKLFIATLPTIRRVVTLHHYQGSWFTEQHIIGVLSAQDHFQSKSTDILLASCPKSGTTWLKALIFATVNRGLYSANSVQHPFHENNPHDLVLDLEFHLHGNNRICEFDSDFPQPRLLATHMPYGSLPQSVIVSGCKIVYIARNPKDNFVSLFHYARNWLPELTLEEWFELYVKGVSMYGPQWDHVLGYWEEAQKNPETMLFLKYEELQAEPSMQLKRLALFMGCPFSEDEEKNGVVEDIVRLCSIKNLTSFEVNKEGIAPFGKGYSTYFRKGKVGDWKNCLTEDMIKAIDEITAQKFQDSGLTI